jgi:hypothetical protein
MDAGIGEAALISAAIGAGTGAAGSSMSGGDPLKGALRGALMGGVTGGIGAGIGGLGSAAGTAAEQTAQQAILDSAASQATSGAGAAFDPISNMSNVGTTGFTDQFGNAVQIPSANPTILSGGSPTTLFANQGVASIPTDAAGYLPSNAGTSSFTDRFGNAFQGPSTNPTILSGSEQQSITGNPLTNQTESKGMFDFGYKGKSPNVLGYGPQSNLGLAGVGIGSGLTAAMQAEREKYMPPGMTPYTGILSKYDPYSARGVQYPTQYAEGGIASLAMGGQPNQMYPMSQQEHTNFMDPSQLPANAMEVRNYEPATNPMTGGMTRPMANGGITSLGSYSDGGRLLRGPGDGMSDNIPATIANKQPARLADGEFVVPADVVSHLGNGSTDAGAKNLYKMMDKVRKARTGNPKQGKQINPGKYLPA